MKKNKNFLAAAIAIFGLAVLSIPASAQAQQSGFKRTDLQQHDLSIPGREVIQSRVDIAPGQISPKHFHPGEEIIYVLEGTFEYQLEGKPPVTLQAGDVLFVPAGTAHTAKNIGTGNAAELATYVVEKGKPLLTIVK
jgi:quercetin dioxygenase-like cupin family protein